MLPWIAGAIVVGVGAYLLDDAKSSNRSARRRYDNEYDNSVARINSGYKNAQRKDALDKLFKVKRAKQSVADTIYNELKSHQKNLATINHQIKESKEMLSALFIQKHSAPTKEEKREIQSSINIVIDSRGELFNIKDGLQSDVLELKSRLREANSETQAIQDEINKIVD
jgi:chromosome segregation ATPase